MKTQTHLSDVRNYLDSCHHCFVHSKYVAWPKRVAQSTQQLDFDVLTASLAVGLAINKAQSLSSTMS